MKNFALLAFSVALLSYQAHARSIETTIVEVETTEDGVLVKAEAEGRALWADPADSALVDALSIAAEGGQTVKLDYDSVTKNIRGAVLLNVEPLAKTPARKNVVTTTPDPAFQFTVFNSFAEAQLRFNGMDTNYRNKSQCYNRAHAWSYDMAVRHGVNSGKVFIFFTSKYIRAYRYEWWFHVAPYVMVNVNGVPVEHVLDRRYTKGPREMRTWTDVFMHNNAFCPQVYKYSDYRKNQQAQSCYLIKTSMYFRSPRNIEHLEKLGTNLTEFAPGSVRAARREAFHNWRRYNP